MKRISLFLIGAVAIAFSSCSTEDDNSQVSAIKENYANIVYNNYRDSYDAAVQLDHYISAFVSNPTQVNLDVMKTSWLAARDIYGQTEGFRFYGGPIDDDNGPEGLINAWPLDESYIDAIIADSVSYPNLTPATLSGLNEQGGEANISTGWHAIEYILWGVDNDPAGPGNRPLTDFTSDTYAHRRLVYLQAVSSLLVENLQEMVDEWKTGASNYRTTFLALDNNTALSYMLQGAGFLAKGELAGERLSVAYDSQLQEDEHSCFSDNTDKDVKANAYSIRNILLGSYTTADGTLIEGESLMDLIDAKNSTVAGELFSALGEAVDACDAIQHPFDQEILASNPDGRARLEHAIEHLRALGDKMSEAAGVLGVSITIE